MHIFLPKTGKMIEPAAVIPVFQDFSKQKEIMENNENKNTSGWQSVCEPIGYHRHYKRPGQIREEFV